MTDERQVIRTSSKGWLSALADAYKRHTPVLVIDDVPVGIDPVKETLFSMGRKAHLSPAEWTAVCIALGMSVAAAALVVAAILDPEPNSKLVLIIMSGAAIFAGGGFAAIRILTKVKPPNIKVGPGGFEVNWT